MEEELNILFDENEKTSLISRTLNAWISTEIETKLNEGSGTTEIKLSCPNLGPSQQNDAAVKIKCETPEQAVRSLDGDFAPWLTAIQLHKYYDTRILTDEQMRAMVKAMNEKALAVPADVLDAFLDSGKICKDCPSHEELIKIAVKIHPDVEMTPAGELFERLKKKLKPSNKRQYGKKIPKDKRAKNEFLFNKGYLYHDGICTYIPERTIDACWNGLVRLVGRNAAIKALAKQILERLSREEL